VRLTRRFAFGAVGRAGTATVNRVEPTAIGRIRDAATPASPAPPGTPVVGGITITSTFGGVFHCRV
jgi:hypothetical protein